MQPYFVRYNNGVPDGLPFPTTLEQRQSNNDEINARMENNWKRIETEKILEGLVVSQHNRIYGRFLVEGPEDKIQTLRSFLEEQEIGEVCENQQLG